MSDAELDEYFRPTLDAWKQSVEAGRLLKLLAEHRQACQHAEHCEAEADALEVAQRQAANGEHGGVLKQLAVRSNEVRMKHEQARQAERLLWSGRELSDANGTARQVLLNLLRARAVQLMTQLGREGGPGWLVANRVTEPELVARADMAVLELQPEGDPHDPVTQ